MRDNTLRPCARQHAGSCDAEARRLTERELDVIRGGKKGDDCYGCGGYGGYYAGYSGYYGGYGWH